MRIRTLKPEFWKNEELATLKPFARLLAIGLLNYVDREGRCEDRPKRIKGEVFPYDECDVDKLLTELQTIGFICRYAVAGQKLIQVLTFSKHQRPNQHETESSLPAHDHACACTNKNTEVGDASIPIIHSIPEGKESEKGGKLRRWPDDLQLTPEMVADCVRICRETAFHVDPQREFVAWRDDCRQHNRKYSDWPAAWRNRIRYAPKFAPNGRASPQGELDTGPRSTGALENLRRAAAEKGQRADVSRES